MILNLLMFFGSFMAFKRPSTRIAAGFMIGIVKGAAYYEITHNAVLSAFMGAVYFSVIIGIVGCLVCLAEQPATLPVYPRYGQTPAQPFQWIYLLLVLLVLFVLFGDLTASFLFS